MGLLRVPVRPFSTEGQVGQKNTVLVWATSGYNII